jgi:hypothetical protein
VSDLTGTRTSTASTAPAGERATLESVARAAGVSRQTVSNALHRPHVLSPGTLERVEQAIALLGYQPNRNAQSLRTGASRLIALRLDPVRTPSGGVLDRFLHALADGLLVTRVPAARLLPARPGRRAVRVPRPARHPQRRRLRPDPDALGRPAAGVPGGARTTRGVLRPAVGHRGRAALGRRRRRLRAPPTPSTTSSPSATGASPSSAGRTAPTSGTTGAAAGRAPSSGTGCPPGPGRRRARTSPRRGPGRPSCSAARTPRPPWSARATCSPSGSCTRCGRSAGASTTVAVVGFDDSPTAALVEPSLTSVAQPLELVAGEIVRVLGELLSSPPSRPPTSPSGVLVRPELVVRDSSQRTAVPSGTCPRSTP